MCNLKCCFVFVMMAFLSASSCLAQTNALNQRLLAYLPLRKDLKDHSTAKNPVKVIGTVEVQDGSTYFDGNESWLDLPHIDFGNHPFAVSMWIQATGNHPMYGLLAQKDDDVTNHWLHLMLRGGRQPYLGFYVNDTISPQDIALGAWTHLVFQYNGTQQEIWIDGQLLCTRKTEAYAGTRGPTAIGKSPNWTNVPSKNFEGYMRDIRMYGRALTVNEITLLHTLEKNPLLATISADGNSIQPVNEVQSRNTLVQSTIPFLSIDAGKLIITGEVGKIYELQATSDLLNAWQPLARLTNQTGVVEYTDTEAQKAAQRFYRIKLH
jgi:Concanavalin A-like lectin/glucanases superfamily